jgi:hypothetical protein
MPGDAGFLCHLVSRLCNTSKPLSGILLWAFFVGPGRLLHTRALRHPSFTATAVSGSTVDRSVSAISSIEAGSGYK